MTTQADFSITTHMFARAWERALAQLPEQEAQGLCIPVHTALGTGGMSLAGSGFDEEPGVRELASLLAFKVCMVLEQIGPTLTGGPRLTTRERDVLSWVAMGKTAEEIGVILSISAHTVGEHLEKVRSKLNASNNAHSIVKALQSGQLQL